MRSEHHDSLEASDPHALLFGPDDHQDGVGGASLRDTPGGYQPGSASRRSRRSRQQQARMQRRRQRRATVAGVLAAVLVVAAGWFVARPLIEERLTPKDWSGSGVGQVLVQVKPNDSAGAIGTTLVKLGVVRTKRAFTNAASDNDASRGIQPGFYRLRKHMAAKQALALLIDPAAKVVSDVTIPEGMTEQDVLVRVAKALGVPASKVAAVAANISDLGLPEGYTSSNGRAPRSAEGFLFPDTYSLDPGTSPADALQEMTSEFTGVDRDMGFADAANKMKITPYEALTVASMIEGEAKFPDDRAKVARVVFNRLAKKMPIGIDATSVYGAKLAGQNPAKIDFNVPAPYNTRLKTGLPPTPIGNPGRAAMDAAVNPTPGNWLYYVNGDAAGHLFFTADPNAFEAAAQKCRQNHWGCS